MTAGVGGGGRGRGGDYGGDTEDDYKEFKNFRANQREETFGTSLADVLGEHLSSLAGNQDAEPEAETPSTTTADDAKE